MNTFNLNEGTINFKIPQGAIDYQGSEQINLINFVSPEGHLKVFKNRDNGMIIDYYYSRFGKCKLVVDARDLDNHQEHGIVISWSTSMGILQLHIDGVDRGSCNITSNNHMMVEN
jgi:hypothetical protein